jgi:prefoldin subunit 5
MQAAIKKLHDAVAILAKIEKKRPESLQEPREELHEFRQRIERNLAEITEKLNRLRQDTP